MDKVELLTKKVEEVCKSMIENAQEKNFEEVWKQSISLAVALTTPLCISGVLKPEMAVELFKEILFKTINSINNLNTTIH